MNLLSHSYKDGGYRHYLDPAPPLAVCVVGENGEILERMLRQSEGTDHTLCISRANSFAYMKPKRVKSTKEGPASGVLKTDWCYNQQYQRFSHILLLASWEEYTLRGLTPELSGVLEEAKAYLAYSNCCVTVAFVANDGRYAADNNIVSEASTEIQAILDGNFSAAVFLGSSAMTTESSDNLRRQVVSAGRKYHRDEIARLADGVRDANATATEEEGDVTGGRVRKQFKCGWHSLVLREYFGARKHMKKAYNYIRTAYPKFASLEARVCASIILFHTVSLAPLCGEDISYVGSVASEIQSHIEWLSEAFTADHSPNCRALLRTIRGVLLADWQEFFAAKVLGTAMAVRRDYYFAAANSLQEILKDLPLVKSTTLEIPPPPFLGTECANDAYAAILSSTISRAEGAERIYSLLDKGCAMAAAPRLFQLEREYIQLQVRSVFAAVDWTADAQSAEKVLARDWKSMLVASSLCELVLDGHENCPEERLLAGIHLLAHAAGELEVKHTVAEQLPQLHKEAPTNFVLAYPYGILLPPIAVAPSFSTFVCEAVNERITLELFLSTTIPLSVSVDSVVATLCDIHDESNSFDVAFSGRATVAPRVGSEQCSLVESLVFARSGDYCCQRVCAMVTVNGTPLQVVLRGTASEEITAREQALLLPRVMRGRRIVRVVKPALFASLEFLAGDSIESVEGEGVSAKFLVTALNGCLRQCNIELPVHTKLFSCHLRDATTGCPLAEAVSPVAKVSKAQIYSLEDFIPSNSAVREFILHCRGLKNGVYAVPVVFHYSVNGYEQLKVTKSIRVLVDPPFEAVHTYIGTAKWNSESGLVHVPAITTMSTQTEKNILLKSKPAIEAGESRGDDTSVAESGNLSLYYSIVHQVKPSGSGEGFLLPYGEQALITSRLTCTAWKGILVRKVEVVPVDGVELLYTSVGELPCHMEYGEAASLVANFRVATRTGRFTPGFVRVLFSPVGAAEELLMADLPLPYLTTVCPGVSLWYTYPEITASRIPFTMSVRISNERSTPLFGEVVLDSATEEFVIPGRCRWRIDVEPNDSATIDVVLIPVRCGTVNLPSLQLLGCRLPAPNGLAQNAYSITIVPGELCA